MKQKGLLFFKNQNKVHEEPLKNYRMFLEPYVILNIVSLNDSSSSETFEVLLGF